jgi:hypothetical protein
VRNVLPSLLCGFAGDSFPLLQEYRRFTFSLMTPLLPVDQMSTEDKLRAMEEIWASLASEPETFESPAWHREVLLETERRVADGREDFLDWESAKDSLRRLAK